MNLAHKFAIECHGGVSACRTLYDGACIDFAGDLIAWIGKGRLAYFDDPPNLYRWRYHAVAVIRGIVHDLWQPEPMRLRDYMERIGATKVEYPK